MVRCGRPSTQVFVVLYNKLVLLPSLYKWEQMYVSIVHSKNMKHVSILEFKVFSLFFFRLLSHCVWILSFIIEELLLIFTSHLYWVSSLLSIYFSIASSPHSKSRPNYFSVVIVCFLYPKIIKAKNKQVHKTC